MDKGEKTRYPHYIARPQLIAKAITGDTVNGRGLKLNKGKADNLPLVQSRSTGSNVFSPNSFEQRFE